MECINYITPVSSFKSGHSVFRTFQECADRCNTFDTCHGFAVVQEGFIPGINRCWLKTLLTFPPPYPNREGVLTYYKVNGEFSPY